MSAAKSFADDHLTRNSIQDFSGIDVSAFPNPYDALLVAAGNDPHELQRRYSTHRSTRNAQQRKTLLDTDFPGLVIDPILSRLEDPAEVASGYTDPRHCLVFWGRPPTHIKELIGGIQQKLKAAAPSLWLMPLDDLHITILEITHSRTAGEIELLKEQVASIADHVVNYTNHERRRAKLIRPLIGFDASALALSFVPAADEGTEFTYHHLRKDVFSIVSGAGVGVDSRYVVPSAHLTIARYITQNDFEKDDANVDSAKLKAFVTIIEELNDWLQQEYWASDGQQAKQNGNWTIGDGSPSIVLRSGTVWYGGGETIAQTTTECAES